MKTWSKAHVLYLIHLLFFSVPHRLLLVVQLCEAVNRGHVAQHHDCLPKSWPHMAQVEP